MERSEISQHEVRIYKVLRDNKQWMTHKDISARSGVNERTVRAHTVRLVKLGLLDQAELFPAHRYRWSDKADKRNKSYLERLERADEVFGVSAA